MSGTQVEKEVESRLAQRGVRFTRGRRAVINALAESGGPLSAAELASRLAPDVPLSSIYRTLAVLEDAGVLTPHLGAKGLTRFELGEWITGHHHHLVCVECGSVDDVPIPQRTEERIRELVGHVAGLAGFDPSDHSLEIEGVCVRCA